MKAKGFLAALGLAASVLPAAAQQQGVTNDEVVLGTIQDLSGPLAGLGKQARAGMLLRVDEINEQGGIQGRKLRLIVEDNGYDPKRASLAAEKLVNRDKVFSIIGQMGTATNMATMPIQFEKNVISFFPLTGAREMYEPPHPLKFAFMPTYYDQMVGALPTMIREKNIKRVCTMYQDDEAGLELLRGAEAGLKVANMEFVERTSFKRGATEFSTQMAKLSAAKCELVVLGTIVRETIGGMSAARRMGFNPEFIATFPAYTELIHKLGGPATDGLYATMTVKIPYIDDKSPAIRFWANKYKTTFGEEPSLFSVYGYYVVDAFASAASRAGKTLTVESFTRGIESAPLATDIFGSPVMTFSKTKRLGNPASRLSQIQNGRWQVVSDYAKTDAAQPAAAMK